MEDRMEASNDSTPRAARVDEQQHATPLAEVNLDGQGREMRVLVRPHGLSLWEYQGSRAQLEAEGVIPAKTEWPEGSRTLRWEDGRFRWSLSRTRPEGLKGPKTLWTSGDWWNLRCDLLNGPDPATLRLQEKRRELAEELYRQSTAGQREWNAHWMRYCASFDDMAFQAFKAKIPGLTPPKRCRKAKTAIAPDGSTAA